MYLEITMMLAASLCILPSALPLMDFNNSHLMFPHLWGLLPAREQWAFLPLVLLAAHLGFYPVVNSTQALAIYDTRLCASVSVLKATVTGPKTTAFFFFSLYRICSKSVITREQKLAWCTHRKKTQRRFHLYHSNKMSLISCWFLGCCFFFLLSFFNSWIF